MSEYANEELGRLAEELARRPYRVEVMVDRGSEGQGWFALVPELAGCMTQAASFNDLEAMIEDAKRAWIYTALEDGIEIPEPQPPADHSGRFVVRTPRSLHRKLAEAAARDGVSLNAWVNVALAQAVGAPAPQAAHQPAQDSAQQPAQQPAPSDEPARPKRRRAARATVAA